MRCKLRALAGICGFGHVSCVERISPYLPSLQKRPIDGVPILGALWSEYDCVWPVGLGNVLLPLRQPSPLAPKLRPLCVNARPGVTFLIQRGPWWVAR